MVEWRPLIIGIFFALAVYAVSLLSGQTTGYLAFLLGGVAVGYMIGGEIKDGAINGAILGLITALITTLILIIQLISFGLGSVIAAALPQILILIATQFIIALVGGILGSLIKEESYEPEIEGT